MTQLDKFAHFIKFLHFKCKVADKILRFYSSMYRLYDIFLVFTDTWVVLINQFFRHFEPLPSYK